MLTLQVCRSVDLHGRLGHVDLPRLFALESDFAVAICTSFQTSLLFAPPAVIIRDSTRLEAVFLGQV